MGAGTIFAIGMGGREGVRYIVRWSMIFLPSEGGFGRRLVDRIEEMQMSGEFTDFVVLVA